jgi:hypothetical protein
MFDMPLNPNNKSKIRNINKIEKMYILKSTTNPPYKTHE